MALSIWQTMYKYSTQSFVLLIAALVIGCSGNSPDNTLDKPEEEYYETAQRYLKSGNYSQAVTELQELEAKYPFGRFAEKAQLDIIYAHYKSQSPEAARSSAERFIRLHPNHQNLDYAYYMKGLAAFNADQDVFAKFLPIDTSKRDPGAAKQSFTDFSDLTRKFPSSQYAADARMRMIFLRNQLSNYELHVSRYYMKRKAYVAAANRARYVIENFQETPSVPTALVLLIESYNRLNLYDLANKSLNVLKENFPEHPTLVNGEYTALEDYDEKNESWLEIMTFGLIDDED